MAEAAIAVAVSSISACLQRADWAQAEAELLGVPDWNAHPVAAATLLNAAAAIAVPEAVELLLVRGVRPTVRGAGGVDETALHRIVSARDAYRLRTFPRVLHLLRACLNETGGPLRQTPLTACIHGIVTAGTNLQRQTTCSYYATVILAEHLAGRLHVDVNAVDQNGRTALHYAGAASNPTLIRLLVLTRARLDLPDQDGRIPWDLALVDFRHMLRPDDPALLETRPLVASKPLSPASLRGAREAKKRARSHTDDASARLGPGVTGIRIVVSRHDDADRGWAAARTLVARACRVPPETVTAAFVEELVSRLPSGILDDIARLQAPVGS